MARWSSLRITYALAVVVILALFVAPLYPGIFGMTSTSGFGQLVIVNLIVWPYCVFLAVFFGVSGGIYPLRVYLGFVVVGAAVLALGLVTPHVVTSNDLHSNGAIVPVAIIAVW
ncbi:hypothetical protein ACFQO4_17065 [Saliphagus sp. GCM10025334]